VYPSTCTQYESVLRLYVVWASGEQRYCTYFCTPIVLHAVICSSKLLYCLNNSSSHRTRVYIVMRLREIRFGNGLSKYSVKRTYTYTRQDIAITHKRYCTLSKDGLLFYLFFGNSVFRIVNYVARCDASESIRTGRGISRNLQPREPSKS